MISTRKTVLSVAALGFSFVVACSSSTSPSSSSTSGSSGASSGTSGASSSSGAASGASSGGSSGTSGAPSGSGFKQCPSSGQSSCSQADVETYGRCMESACDATYQECMGAGFKTGTFSGACGTYMACESKCACGDTACIMACGMPDAACTACMQKLSACTTNASCTKPACMAAPPPPPPPGSSGSSGSSGATGATCADLQTCCDKIADASIKDACQQSHDGAAGNDSTCNTYYGGFKTLCP